MSTTGSTIAITTAAEQLGLPEYEFRQLLQGVVKNHATAKKISIDKFRLIAETLQTRALESNQDTKLQDELTTENATEDTEESSLANTETEQTQLDLERTRLQLNINLNLQHQVLDLNRITSALALVSGEQIVQNFEEIFTHTINTGVDRVLSKIATQTHQTIKQLREVDNSDFLSQYGRNTQITDSQQATNQVLQQL